MLDFWYRLQHVAVAIRNAPPPVVLSPTWFGFQSRDGARIFGGHVVDANPYTRARLVGCGASRDARFDIVMKMWQTH